MAIPPTLTGLPEQALLNYFNALAEATGVIQPHYHPGSGLPPGQIRLDGIFRAPVPIYKDGQMRGLH